MERRPCDVKLPGPVDGPRAVDVIIVPFRFQSWEITENKKHFLEISSREDQQQVEEVTGCDVTVAGHRHRRHFSAAADDFLSVYRLSRHTAHTLTASEDIHVQRHVHTSNLGRERKHASGESLDEAHEYRSVWSSKQKSVSKHNRSENIHFLSVEMRPNWGETIQPLAILSVWLVALQIPPPQHSRRLDEQ